MTTTRQILDGASDRLLELFGNRSGNERVQQRGRITTFEFCILVWLFLACNGLGFSLSLSYVDNFEVRLTVETSANYLQCASRARSNNSDVSAGSDVIAEHMFWS